MGNAACKFCVYQAQCRNGRKVCPNKLKQKPGIIAKVGQK